MEFIADFHVHSKYSRATAKTLDLEHLYTAARIKGISVIGTGDFTHPAWFSEISEKLVPAEEGLFKLRGDLAALCEKEIPATCRQPVRFVLTTEISNIYKKNEKTRKNHNLIFFPDLASVLQFNKRLDAIGNITSDGRPILGLDAKHLLEIMLEVDDTGFLVPAHIWTPWFSLLGSKSGFDSITECFEDLAPHIFAAETGLSSDPAMNWRLSALDGITLVSNSDAHSPFNLGREANRFNTDLSFSAIRTALETGDPETFLGTFEFFPEEGKYHFDGHRKCDICFHPKESLSHNGICPECQKPLTLGVLYRVEELADRDEGTVPDGAFPFHSIVPLTDILSDILKVGPKTKKVAAGYDQAIASLGTEFDILHALPAEKLKAAKIPLLEEAIIRMRAGRISLSPGYDGEFGKVRFFSDEERDSLLGQKALFKLPAARSGKKKSSAPDPWQIKVPEKKAQTLPPVYQKPLKQAAPSFEDTGGIVDRLNQEQKRAVLHGRAPLIISAGPGTGKTRTLTHRIAHLITEKSILSDCVLALTFTQKAAEEMRHRLSALLTRDKVPSAITTFHGFCHNFLSERQKGLQEAAYTLMDEKARASMVDMAVALSGYSCREGLSNASVAGLITAAKQALRTPADDLSSLVSEDDHTAFASIYQTYCRILKFQNLMDYEDLILTVVNLFESGDDFAMTFKHRFSHFFVDEYQDLNHGQFRLLQLLSPAGDNLCVIGDPNQAIYGFQGADPAYFNRFVRDFPRAQTIVLTQNYRSVDTILEASAQVLAESSGQGPSLRLYSGINGIAQIGVIAAPTERSEAVAVGKCIEKMVGGTGFHFMDAGQYPISGLDKERSFGDFAILFRTHAQIRMMAETLTKANIPCQVAQKNDIVSEKGIAELLALFRLTINSGTIFDFEKILSLSGSGIGAKTVNAFKQWYFEYKKPLAKALLDIRRFPASHMTRTAQLKIDRLLSRIHQLRDTLEDFTIPEQLIHLSRVPLIRRVMEANPNARDKLEVILEHAARYPYDTIRFCSELSLCTDTDYFEDKVEKVTLMTLHAAKGLEFPVVFICGCEDGLIPFANRPDRLSNLDEERRLFYVGMTRAKEDLYFSWAGKRNLFGKIEERAMSPFIAAIESQLIRDEKSDARPAKPKSPSQLPLF